MSNVTPLRANPPPPEDIAWRRFGPRFERKCNNPQVIECARYRCQLANQCQEASPNG